MLAAIEERFAERIQLKDLAAVANMSRFHFSRMFKISTGGTPHDFLTRKRMRRAQELLATSDMPFAAIAKAVGYCTQAHFISVFRRQLGTTPRAFRVAQQNAAVWKAVAPQNQP